MHKSGIVKPLAVIVAFTAITPLLSTAPSALAREASNNAITATTDIAEGARLIRQITVKDPKGTTRTPSDPTTVHASHGDTVTVKVTIESKDRNSRGFSDFTELVPAVGQLNKEAITYTIDQQPLQNSSRKDGKYKSSPIKSGSEIKTSQTFFSDEKSLSNTHTPSTLARRNHEQQESWLTATQTTTLAPWAPTSWWINLIQQETSAHCGKVSCAHYHTSSAHS